MSKNTLKFIVILVLSVFVSVPIVTSSLLDLKQKKENELIYRKLLEAREKIYLTGKFDPAQKEDFILIPSQYTLGENKMYLRKETFESFLKMVSVAKKDEVDLKIASATRNFDYQKNLWNNKWSGFTIVNGQNLNIEIPDGLKRFEKILEYSAVPGTSRHHWGTDIDINDANPAYFNKEKGKKEYEWLIKNASAFGFCQTYNQKNVDRKTGYNEEKWHWSYLPLARVFTQEYKNLIKNDDIKGFEGEEYVTGQDLINNYVLSINPDCI